MKKFIINCISFSMLVVFMIIFCEILISISLRKIKNDYIFSPWNEIYDSNMDHDILIMGSSRAAVQYNPAVLDTVMSMKAYNLGSAGRLIDSQIVKYNFYRKYNKKPKYIIQNVDYVTLALSDEFQRDQFFPYFYDKDIKKYAIERLNLSFPSLYLPFFRYSTSRESVFYALRVAVYRVNIIKGFVGHDDIFDRKDLDQRQSIPLRREARATELFEEYLSKASSEGIKVIFVFAPVYHEMVSKIDNIELMYEIFYGIADKYQIPVIDYTFDEMCSDTKYFYDPAHLNLLGANMFSYKLGKDLSRILSD